MKKKLTMFVTVTGFGGDCFRQIIKDCGGVLANTIEEANIIVCSDRWDLNQTLEQFPDKGSVLFSVVDSGKMLPKNCRWIDGMSTYMFEVISNMSWTEFVANCRLMSAERPAPEPMFA